jgi:hypothetical protein
MCTKICLAHNIILDVKERTQSNSSVFTSQNLAILTANDKHTTERSILREILPKLYSGRNRFKLI